MPRYCLVCRHPKRNEIEQQVLAKTPYREIVEKYQKISISGLCRHILDGHITQEIRDAKIQRTVEHLSGLDKLVEDITTKSMKYAECAAKEYRYNAIGPIMANAARMAELRVKMEGNNAETPSTIYDYLNKHKSTKQQEG